MSKRKAPDEWLATLLPPRQFPDTPLIPGGGAVTKSDTLLEIPLDSLDANPYQTRTALDERSLDELADSIRSLGLMEPIVVRANGGGRYQVIAGERRVKACYIAHVYKVPAVVRHVTDEQAAEMTVIENLLREEVNPMDQARAFRRLMQEFGLTEEEIAKRTGKSRSAVSNFLRILQLPEPVQNKVERGTLTAGHAKALLSLAEQPQEVVLQFAEKASSLSVRETEKRIAQLLDPAEPDPTEDPRRWLRPGLRDAEQLLRRKFDNQKVCVIENGGEGHLRIPFVDLYEFERLFATLTGQKLEIAYPRPDEE
jgi:ParB family chromosome partitioning protein